MAASALRLGGKILQLEALSLRAVQPSVSLCTTSGAPKKEPAKNVVTPEKRSKVLAAKSTVELPKKASSSTRPLTANVHPDGAPRVSEKETAQVLARKTFVQFPQRDPFPVLEDTVAAAVDGPTDERTGEEEETASSSSSDSDSDSSSSSDSDSESSSGSESEGEGDAVDVPVKTRVEFPVRGPSLIEGHHVNKEVNKVDAAPKKHTKREKMEACVPPDAHPKESRKTMNAEGGTAEKKADSRITKPPKEKVQSMISKLRIVGKPAKPGDKVDAAPGSLPVPPPAQGPTQAKLAKKGAKPGSRQESRGAKEPPLENPKEFVKGITPRISPETTSGQAVSLKATQESSTQEASSLTKDPGTTLANAIHSKETVASQDASAAETGKPGSLPGVGLEKLEQGATPDKAAKITKPSTTPDKTAEILEPSATPDKAAEILESSPTPDKAAEILDSSTTPDKAAEILDSSTTPDKAAEILEPSITPDETIKTEEPGTTSAATAENGESSTILEKEAASTSHEQEFDNSTYRNLQHHSFTPYTFVDIELELSKFRLPQPSSGRPSPRD